MNKQDYERAEEIIEGTEKRRKVEVMPSRADIDWLLNQAQKKWYRGSEMLVGIRGQKATIRELERLKKEGVKSLPIV